MKKTGLFIFISSIAVIALAQDWNHLKSSLYDVVAPSIYGDPNTGDRIQGQIYYDVNTGAFKGINKNGTADVLATSGATAVTSSGVERVERAILAAPSAGVCSVTKESGDWINGTPTSSGTGACSITINSGIFSDTPTCICTVSFSTAGNTVCRLSTTVTSSGFSIQVFDVTSINQNEPVHIICMGER